MSPARKLLNGILIAVALGPVAGAAGATKNSDIQKEKMQIAALRRENNEAIATRNLSGVLKILADNYAAVGGNDGIIRSKEEARELWLKDFARAHRLDQCIRQPSQILVGQAGGVLRAAELGSWRCPSQTEQGEATPHGRYFAHWSKRSGEWRVVSDNYVTLECTGPGCRTTP